jgi:hypothetical protein
LPNKIATHLSSPSEQTPARWKGRGLGSDKKPFGAATVVLIPEDSLRFRINHKYTSTDDAGHFQLKGIAPGDYKLSCGNKPTEVRGRIPSS